MATKLQRTQSILDALTDSAAPPAVVGRALDAFALAYAPDEAATMTNTQKAAVFLTATRRFVRETVQGVEVQTAERAARQSIQPPELGTD